MDILSNPSLELMFEVASGYKIDSKIQRFCIKHNLFITPALKKFKQFYIDLLSIMGLEYSDSFEEVERSIISAISEDIDLLDKTIAFIKDSKLTGKYFINPSNKNSEEYLTIHDYSSFLIGNFQKRTLNRLWKDKILQNNPALYKEVTSVYMMAYSLVTEEEVKIPIDFMKKYVAYQDLIVALCRNNPSPEAISYAMAESEKMKELINKEVQHQSYIFLNP